MRFGGHDGGMNDTFAPGDDTRFRSNALISIVAFVGVTLLGALAFLLLF